MSEYEKDLIKKLAARALHHAIRQHWSLATAAVQKINDRFGADGIDYAVIIWIDTLADRLGITSGTPVAVAFQHAGTGQRGSADDVPPKVAWAGQLINARFQLDQDTYRALIAALPDDPKAIGDHVGAVLECIALTLPKAS